MQMMLSYFLDAIAGDGKSSSNFKAISEWSKSSETPIGQHLSVIDPNDWARSRQRISIPTRTCVIMHLPEVVSNF